MTNKEKELFAENEELKKEIKDLKERIHHRTDYINSLWILDYKNRSLQQLS